MEHLSVPSDPASIRETHSLDGSRAGSGTCQSRGEKLIG